MKRKPWYIGNTTVRNPYRLKDGLKALYNSPFHGNLDTKDEQIGFFNVLLENNVITSRAIKEPDFFGRKWRAAFSQLGFIVPKQAYKVNKKFKPFTITPNGKKLIHAKTVPEVNECFLRALSAYYIPSVLEKYEGYDVFSPLRHVLNVMLTLKEITGSSHLYQRELGMFVQISSSSDNIEYLVKSIIKYRNARKKAKNKKTFDREYYIKQSENTTVKWETLKDYADSNIRYFKITGLFRSKGRGIVLIPEKELLAKQLIQYDIYTDNNVDYLEQLFKGAKLPSDNIENAVILLENLIEQIESQNIPIQIPSFDYFDIQSLNAARYKIEEQLFKHMEIEYANMQKKQWRDIVAYMNALVSRNYKAFELPDSKDEGRIPKDEFPAYFEWVVWRAFLAINKLVNKPYEARSFQIDQDFLPVNTAPGGRADAIFEFKDYVLVLEVTLTESSRQEAAEGEPVRRHVADYQQYYQQYKKPVYGLFLANKINTNTLETFRSGLWYTSQDEKLLLKIVPMTLESYKEIFKTLFESGNIDNLHIKNILDVCLKNKNTLEAPQWRGKITKSIQFYLNRYINT